MDHKIYSFLGLAQKAGKLTSGDYCVENAVRCKGALLVIISEDASHNTRKKFQNACDFRNIPFLIFGNKQQLGRAIGKNERSVIALTDEGFSKRIMGLLGELGKRYNH